MSKADAQQLHDALSIPAQFVLNDRAVVPNRHKFRVDGMHAFLYFLCRMFRPSARMAEDEDRFGYAQSALSRMFRTVLRFVDERHGHCLRQLERFAHRFPEFHEAVARTIRGKNALTADAPLPPSMSRVALFGDAMCLQDARPDGIPWACSGRTGCSTTGSTAPSRAAACATSSRPVE